MKRRSIEWSIIENSDSPACSWALDHIVQGSPFTKQLKVQAIISVGKEDTLPPVAPLGNVMGNAGNNYAGKSSHS